MQSVSGKLIASGFSALQETTLALANINFDFTLYKVTPPVEYEEVGKALTQKRRDAAENGSEHVIARKLGALFSQCVPTTPHLVKVYGLRASEIARSSAKMNSSRKEHGIFNGFAGPDGTSIWAAATSGAIAVHLLACMLARAWPPDKAEAIWDEIILARKKELMDMDPADQLYELKELAARIDLDRDQISLWNASAKAWLEIADGVKKKQQIQLELLLGNITLTTGGDESTYQSVMRSWNLALQSVERLCMGDPHIVQDGAVILGLKSWHLFPDIYALGAGPDKILQHDALMPQSAVVTLGASSCSPDNEGSVYWSLPLSYLRYYGDPVPTSTNIGEPTTQLRFPEFFQVVLGTIFSSWGESASDLEKASRFVLCLGEFVSGNQSIHHAAPNSWLDFLAQSAELFLSATGDEMQHFRNLILRGRRRYKNFLAEPGEHPPPLFGLGRVSVMLSLFRKIEHKIAALRLFAARFITAQPDALIIRYPRKLSEDQHLHKTSTDDLEYEINRTLEEGKRDNSPTLTANTFFPPDGYEWEYATALDADHNPKKRKQNPETDFSGHSRWIISSFFASRTREARGERYEDLNTIEVLPHGRDGFRWNKAPVHTTLSRQSDQKNVVFEHVLGDPKDVAIFRDVSKDVTGYDKADIDLLIIAFQQRWFHYPSLVRHLEDMGKGALQITRPSASSSFTKTLRALAAAGDAYKLMPNATIPTSIFSKPLRNSPWFPDQVMPPPEESVQSLEDSTATHASNFILPTGTIDPRMLHQQPNGEDECDMRDTTSQGVDLIRYRLTRAQTFACIAMFENANVHLDPRTLTQVMALSSGNSIYVARPLLCDPIDCPSPCEVNHIVGNISQPGISLMIPPIRPRVQKPDESIWRQVNHNEFDGKLDDCFQHTSLHLSFTRYKLPASIASHGDQAVEANFIETLVSVFDKQQWIADLDVLGSLEKLLWRVDEPFSCRHKRPLTTPRFSLTSTDCWDEFLDPSPVPRIFRAHKNWLATIHTMAYH
jgi:hypothetical protein